MFQALITFLCLLVQMTWQKGDANVLRVHQRFSRHLCIFVLVCALPTVTRDVTGRGTANLSVFPVHVSRTATTLELSRMSTRNRGWPRKVVQGSPATREPRRRSRKSPPAPSLRDHSTRTLLSAALLEQGCRDTEPGSHAEGALHYARGKRQRTATRGAP